MLFNEPKLLKSIVEENLRRNRRRVSVLFNEPKLLKFLYFVAAQHFRHSFSALQRAEIAEINWKWSVKYGIVSFSALQRAEIAEIAVGERALYRQLGRFSALQRAEIAEMVGASP